jgi:UV excision repair protein RAD23
VKEKISAEKGWEASQQKLIYSGGYPPAASPSVSVDIWVSVLIPWRWPGKILADANTVESYNIEEKGFIVCMVSKVRMLRSTKVSPLISYPAKSTACSCASKSGGYTLHASSFDVDTSSSASPTTTCCLGGFKSPCYTIADAIRWGRTNRATPSRRASSQL